MLPLLKQHSMLLSYVSCVKLPLSLLACFVKNLSIEPYALHAMQHRRE
jgi:hypothetical protein